MGAILDCFRGSTNEQRRQSDRAIPPDAVSEVRVSGEIEMSIE